MDRLVPKGYGRLVQAYGQGIPVHLEAVVQRIDYRGPMVEVTGNQGKLRGKWVIVTIPIGVLAADRIGFDPPLPPDKIRANGGLPMGLLAKVFLAFDENPFDLGDGFYLHQLTENERAALYFCRPTGTDYVTAFVGGSLARELEVAGEQAAADFALGPLHDLFGSMIDKHFLGCCQTRWSADPFSLGSYSVARPEAVDCRQALAAPIDGRVFFTGEAAVIDGWAATVAGAYRGGRRAARDVLSAMEAAGSMRKA